MCNCNGSGQNLPGNTSAVRLLENNCTLWNVQQPIRIKHSRVPYNNPK